MRSSFRVMMTAVVLGMLLVPGQAVFADECNKKIEIPEAVLQAFEKAYPSVEATGYDKETIEDVVHYEIETMAGEFEKDYVYLEDGTLLQIEEGIPVKDMPKVVADAVKKAHPEGELDEAEKITRGEVIEYEIVVEIGEKEFELLVASDGNIIASQELNEDEDGDDDHGDHDDDDDD